MKHEQTIISWSELFRNSREAFKLPWNLGTYPLEFLRLLDIQRLISPSILESEWPNMRGRIHLRIGAYLDTATDLFG